MKILYLKLQNFANIYAGMHRKSIEIDFTKCKNRIVLLVGANGSGKTSILSELQPFAYVGNLDVRNGTNLILENNDGYKEIHILYDSDVYVIKHFYKNSKKGSITLKSFISRNGEELNPNGNVTSFLDIVKKELSVEPDHLKLLRLGANVSTLIDMKASERKNFTSELLSDIDVYNELFKKANDDTRVLRSLIKTVSDKIERLNVLDKDLLKADISAGETKLRELRSSVEILQKESGAIDGIISTLIPGDVVSFKETIVDLSNERNELMDKILQNQREIEHLILVIDGDIDVYVSGLIDNKSGIERELAVVNTKISTYRTQQNELYNRRDELQQELKILASDVEENQLMKMYLELKTKHDEMCKRFRDNRPVHSKERIMVLLNILREINDIAKTIYEFDSKAIREAIKLIKDGHSVIAYAEKEISKIDRKMMNLANHARFDTIKENSLVLFRPSECNINDCPYLDLYDQLYSVGNKEDTLDDLESKRTYLGQLTNIGKNLEYIFVILKSNRSTISGSGIEYLTIESILSRIDMFVDIYDEASMTTIISYIEDYEEYLEIKGKMAEIRQDLSDVSSNTTSISIFKKTLVETEKKLLEVEKILSDLRQESQRINTILEKTISFIRDVEIYRTTTARIAELQSEHDAISRDIVDRKNRLRSISQSLEKKTRIQQQIDTLVWSIGKLEKELFDNKVSLNEFETLSSEQTVLREKFDDLSIIRESLSSTKGIPLLYIQLYLKNTKMYVNELLSSIYGDEFEIDDFIINANEFNIPYIKNGIRVNDVVYASQGERSFLSLALSFAIINQSIENYNILLLDELDSTLDARNRPLFLSILEKQMDTINAEQIFLITHNDMFDSYPVDIILTSGEASGKNVIFKA